MADDSGYILPLNPWHHPKKDSAAQQQPAKQDPGALFDPSVDPGVTLGPQVSSPSWTPNKIKPPPQWPGHPGVVPVTPPIEMTPAYGVEYLRRKLKEDIENLQESEASAFYIERFLKRLK